MQPIDAVWILGLIWIFYFLFVRKDKLESENTDQKKT
jgi:hypothetical protein